MVSCTFIELNSFLWILLIQSPKCSSGLKPPSYISTWQHMNVSSSLNRTIRWSHGLNEDPVYADIQVRSITTGYIYPGIGSGFITDDAEIRGGVVFWYNENVVEVHIPTHSPNSTAYLIFTGQVGYNLENPESLETGEVRVRLWRISDFPPNSERIDFTIKSPSANISKSHRLTKIPAFTVVQLDLTGAGLSKWLTQAQGSGSLYSATSGGGTVYGVNATNVWLWTYAKVFNFCDGFGDTPSITVCDSSQAKVTIWLWECLETNVSFSTSVNTTSHEVNITTSFSHDEDLIVVRAESTTGSLLGFYFDGIGAAMVDTQDDNPDYELGGLVYATNNISIRMWHPVVNKLNSSYVRCIVLASSNNCVTEAIVHVVIYKGLNVSYTPVLRNAHVVQHKACFYEFACNDSYTHTAGDLTSFYVGGVWNGSQPTCVNCDGIEGGTNAILRGNTNAHIRYTCAEDYVLVTGNLSRICVETSPDNFNWTGTPPVCQLAGTNITELCYAIATITPDAIQEAIEIAEEISKNLTVDVKATGAYKRSLVCAQDTRASALYVGILGYIVFGIVFGFIFLLDGFNLIMFLYGSK